MVVSLSRAEFSKVQQSFAQVLGNFKFQTIGDQTEDEKMISKLPDPFSFREGITVISRIVGPKNHGEHALISPLLK